MPRRWFTTTTQSSAINFSRRPESARTLADHHSEELNIHTYMFTAFIITNVYIPQQHFAQEDTIYLWIIWWWRRSPSYWKTSMLTTHRDIQVQHIPEAPCWRAWCLALTTVFSTGIHQLDYRETPTQVPLMSHYHQPLLYQLADEDKPRLRPSTNHN